MTIELFAYSLFDDHSDKHIADLCTPYQLDYDDELVIKASSENELIYRIKSILVTDSMTLSAQPVTRLYCSLVEQRTKFDFKEKLKYLEAASEIFKKVDADAEEE